MKTCELLITALLINAALASSYENNKTNKHHEIDNITFKNEKLKNKKSPKQTIYNQDNVNKIDKHIVKIERIADKEDAFDFFNSTDTFTNLYRLHANRSWFCTAKNARCRSLPDCQECECRKNENFVSYKHGCLNYAKTMMALNATDCLLYKSGATFLPTATNQTDWRDDAHSDCLSLRRQTFYQTKIDWWLKPCIAWNLQTFDGRDGRESFLLQNKRQRIFEVGTNYFRKCLKKGSRFSSYARTAMAGRIVKIPITCRKYLTSYITKCFVFKYVGSAAYPNIKLVPPPPSPLTTKPTQTSTPKSSQTKDTSGASTEKQKVAGKNKTFIALIIALSVLLVFLLSILLPLVMAIRYFKKKSLNRQRKDTSVYVEKVALSDLGSCATASTAMALSNQGTTRERRQEFNNFGYEHVQNAKQNRDIIPLQNNTEEKNVQPSGGDSSNDSQIYASIALPNAYVDVVPNNNLVSNVDAVSNLYADVPLSTQENPIYGVEGEYAQIQNIDVNGHSACENAHKSKDNGQNYITPYKVSVDNSKMVKTSENTIYNDNASFYDRQTSDKVAVENLKTSENTIYNDNASFYDRQTSDKVAVENLKTSENTIYNSEDANIYMQPGVTDTRETTPGDSSYSEIANYSQIGGLQNNPILKNATFEQNLPNLADDKRFSDNNTLYGTKSFSNN